MCRKYVIGSSLETIQKKFNVESPSIKEWKQGQIISASNEALIITQEKPSEIILSPFGMIPSWSKKELPIVNARAEGDKNPDNSPSFSGSKAIFQNRAFQKPLFFRRCLVIADAFIEWSIAADKQPYLVYLRNRERPFAIAGLYDIWTNPKTLEKHLTFTIITVPGNKLLRKLPYTRMPVILAKGKEKLWLKPDSSLREILSQLQMYPSKLMNAYPIDPHINTPLTNDMQLIMPKGDIIFSEITNVNLQRASFQAYFSSKKKKIFDNSKPSLGELSWLTGLQNKEHP